MSDYPISVPAGSTFNLWAGGKYYTCRAMSTTTLRNEDDMLDFVSGYAYPVTFEPGDTIKLLGRVVVTAQRKTFEDYRSMEWWCSTADGIPELGLFDATSDD